MKDYRFDEESIRLLIEKSNLEISEKKLLEEVVDGIQNHYKKFLNHLENRIYKDNQFENKGIIYATLAKDFEVKELEKIGFNKIFEEECFMGEMEKKYICSVLYYEGEYFEKNKYLDKSYKGKIICFNESGEEIERDINYYLYEMEVDKNFLEGKYSLLEKLKKNYKINVNKVYYPFENRMLYTYICVDYEELKNEKWKLKEVKLYLDKNGLENFKTNIIPMWNISFEDIKPKVTSKKENEEIEYFFIRDKENEFILPQGRGNYRFIENNEKIWITSTSSEEEFIKIEFNSINKNKVNGTIYSNEEREDYYNSHQRKRLRTIGDFENFINRYEDVFPSINFKISNEPLPINKYFKNKFPRNKEIFKCQYKNILYIQFIVDRKDYLYVDYLYFILRELQENYSEIHWIGGI